ncbi:putative amino acid ABC transporter, permease protein [Vibrio ponticus]|nr:putative amino acid ABC transporter, permease protein [Vibrio ponticus]
MGLLRMPTLMDVSLNHFWAGVIALTIAESAFMAEVFRGGIQASIEGNMRRQNLLGSITGRKCGW